MLVVRSVAGPMVVRRRDTVVLRAPAVTPSTSASNSAAELSRRMYREQPEQPALTCAGHVDVHSLAMSLRTLLRARVSRLASYPGRSRG